MIRQDQCAMKVCTDSCVFGAYVPVAKAQRILDIGAGTGLLSLMVAQRAPHAKIKAVEIDAAAARQAQENVAQSPWPGRIEVLGTSLQEFAATQPAPFDTIICNPPFFQASLKSPNAARNTAKHTGQLSFGEILAFADRFLSAEGQLHILLPPHEANVFRQEAALHGFYPHDILWLEASPGGKLLRAIHAYARAKTEPTEHTLAVKEQDHKTYTQPFQELLKPYYLHL
nr:methyltransferase [Rufibacter sp. LB8]